jgi:hypothetical protein
LVAIGFTKTESEKKNDLQNPKIKILSYGISTARVRCETETFNSRQGQVAEDVQNECWIVAERGFSETSDHTSPTPRVKVGSENCFHIQEENNDIKSCSKAESQQDHLQMAFR